MYVIKSSSGKFIALDAASGGYPYETSFFRARFWDIGEKKELKRYFDTFTKGPNNSYLHDNTWTIHSVTYSTHPIDPRMLES